MDVDAAAAAVDRGVVGEGAAGSKERHLLQRRVYMSFSVLGDVRFDVEVIIAEERAAVLAKTVQFKMRFRTTVDTNVQVSAESNPSFGLK